MDDPSAYDDPSAWTTTYLHTKHLFQTRFAPMFQKLRALAMEADAETWGLVAAGETAGVIRSPGSPQTHPPQPSQPHPPPQWQVHPRVIEVHEAGAGAGLPFDKHYDSGSIVTLDVLLSSRDEFEGGHFQTLEPDGLTRTRPDFQPTLPFPF